MKIGFKWRCGPRVFLRLVPRGRVFAFAITKTPGAIQCGFFWKLPK